MSKQSFFDEVVEDAWGMKLNLHALGLYLGVILLWVYVAVPEQQSNAMVYMIMLIVWGFIMAFDYRDSLGKTEDFLRVNGMGKNPLQNFLLGAVLFGLVVGVTSFSIIPLSIVDASLLSFLFIVVAAPLVEANFFRGLVQGQLTQFGEVFLGMSRQISFGFATVLQSLIFAFFHVVIFSNPINVFVSAIPYFVFGVLMTVLVYYFKDVSVEYGAHGINNLIAWFGMV
jgi:membrane protease YdiL (CAAX protease family)